MTRGMRFILITSIIIILLSGAFFVALFKPLDTSIYTSTAFYKRELDSLNTVMPAANLNDTVLAGWARVNLQPPFGTPIAIDAHRGGKHFEGVHDSIYVRAFVFKAGNYKVAFIAADLLIIPPSVSMLLDSVMQPYGYSAANIYYSATHAHSSIGAWQNSWVGEKFAGKYDGRVPALFTERFKQAILIAEQDLQPVQSGFVAIPTQKLVYNRLVNDSGTVDSLLRVVKLVKANGDEAAIISFAAHATVYHEGMMQLSGDWPNAMALQLQSARPKAFFSYSAGAVGSQGPFKYSDKQDEELNYMATSVADSVLKYWDSIPLGQPKGLQMVHLPLYLREPNLRLTPTYVLRPALFKKLFGDYPAYINYLQIGKVAFCGMPCDFSGELTAPFDELGAKKGINPLTTSFNGTYIGYITRDDWYGLDTYETGTMGWFGPGNGSYLQEVVLRLISRANP